MLEKRYQLCCNFKNDEKLRASFHQLVRQTFGFDFEQWYQYGYWDDFYCPYAILDLNTEQIVSNVSVSMMKFHCNGEEKRFVQFGTVMTHPDYQRQGLSRFLIEQVLREYQDKVDGFYLYANEEVLDFYPKFGFFRKTEYFYQKQVTFDTTRTIQPYCMGEAENRKKFKMAVENRVFQGSFEMAGHANLIMFYTTGFLKDCVYYSSHQDTFVVAEIREKTLILYGLFSDKVIDLECVISEFGSDIQTVVLGFTPFDTTGFTMSEVLQEDNLFVKGEKFDFLDFEKKCFPILSHT